MEELQKTPPKTALSADGSDCPFITTWTNQSAYSLKITGGEPYSGQALSPPVGTIIEAGADYDYCIFDYILVDLYSAPNAQGDYLGTASVSVQTDSGGNQYLVDANNLLVFTYDAGKSSYPGSNCWDWRRAENITASSIAAGPPVITNDDWNNGLGNSDGKITADASFFVQDYGLDETDRWTVADGAICQSTAELTPGNFGSRAYPVYLSNGAPAWTILNCDADGTSCKNPVAPGTGFEGCWQVSMKCGSNGAGPFCETFYLAERTVLAAGPENYQDGSGSALGGDSREIDLMETRWQPSGPQANCPNGVGTGWNTDWANQLMGQWSDIGGIPMTDFAIFGCLIRDGNLWIYGYQPDGSPWYCSDPIPMNNSGYQQKNPFVAYIGTWTDGGSAGGFETCYNNFIYLAADDPKIDGKDPVNNPDSFGGALIGG
ncbi:MAG: hypothetical protein AAFW73_26485 [Bacteroidota bacterium]